MKMSNEELAEKVVEFYKEFEMPKLDKFGKKMNSFCYYTLTGFAEEFYKWMQDDINNGREVLDGITVYRICEHCNKEYEPTFGIIKHGKVAINNFQECPNCGERDDAWIKIDLDEK